MKSTHDLWNSLGLGTRGAVDNDPDLKHSDMLAKKQATDQDNNLTGAHSTVDERFHTWFSFG